MTTTRFSSSAGIAIGPILFIVAILAVLAAAIAAGSGSFTAGTATEANKTNAAAMLQIGQNLKIGMDRIMGSTTDSSLTVASVVIDTAQTSGATDLFSPTGGGIAPPSRALAAATTDDWEYPAVAWTGLGTSSTDRVATLRISTATTTPAASTLCGEINTRVGNSSAGPASADWSDPGNGTIVIPAGANGATFVSGRQTGCFVHSGTDPDGQYFFQVIGIR